MPQLLEFTKRGLFCEQGNFYIDPFYPCDKALITHAHGDHARWGMGSYLAHKDSIPIMKIRLGAGINYQSVQYGEIIYINGIKISFHPAGHIIGSSQIRLEYKGEVWVASGDYKTEFDGISVPFEPVKCNTFITESTFGLPIFNWAPQKEVFNDINNWWKVCQTKQECAIIYAYSLGKAQRILKNIDKSIGNIYLHGAIYTLNQALKLEGWELPKLEKVDKDIPKENFRKSLIIAPPSADGSSWMKKFGTVSTASASGWMAIRGNKRRRSLDKGFVLSDHADWKGLNEAIESTGAENVIVTHGYTQIFAKWLKDKGYNAITAGSVFEQEFGTEEKDEVTENQDNLESIDTSTNIEEEIEFEEKDYNSIKLKND